MFRGSTPETSLKTPNVPPKKRQKVDKEYTYNDTEIVFRIAIVTGFEIFKPRTGLVARKSFQIHISKLGDPSFFSLHGSTIDSASLSNAKMLVIASSKPIVEITKCTGEGCAGWRIVVHADDVDIIGSGPPRLDVFDGVVIWAPEHENFGIIGYGSVDVLPGGDEFICSCDALD